MDATKFFKEWNRMCDTVTDCKNCPIGNQHLPATRNECALFAFYNGDVTVKCVEKWSKEHPQKTRLQDFKEKYPKSKIEEENYENICCEVVGYCKKCSHGYDAAACKDCWNEPV